MYFGGFILDLLRSRHDAAKAKPDNGQYNPLPNPERRGNVSFIDGHAESLRFADVFTSVYVNHFDPASPQPRATP